MTERLKRDHDLAVAKSRLLDELIERLEGLSADEVKHRDLAHSLDVALRVVKLERRVAEQAVAARYPEVRS